MKFFIILHFYTKNNWPGSQLHEVLFGAKSSFMELILQEGDYLIKTLSTHEEMETAFRLRHEVFVDEPR